MADNLKKSQQNLNKNKKKRGTRLTSTCPCLIPQLIQNPENTKKWKPIDKLFDYIPQAMMGPILASLLGGQDKTDVVSLAKQAGNVSDSHLATCHWPKWLIHWLPDWRFHFFLSNESFNPKVLPVGLGVRKNSKTKNPANHHSNFGIVFFFN